jgi:phosphotransferase system  glucose/maltose/N-acetylglucosamine-specific IIC component
MDTKKWLTAGLAGFVVMFILSGLWYMVIMAGFYETQNAAVSREQFNFLFIVLGYIVLAALMSYMYPVGYKGGSPTKEGLRFGILIGLLVALPMNLILHGVWKVTLAGSLVDSAWHVVEKGIGGIVIALVYGTSSDEGSG